MKEVRGNGLCDGCKATVAGPTVGIHFPSLSTKHQVSKVPLLLALKLIGHNGDSIIIITIIIGYGVKVYRCVLLHFTRGTMQKACVLLGFTTGTT